MMKSTTLSIFAIILSGGFVMADPIEDARYIVQQTVTEDVMAASMGGLASLMIGSIQNEMTKNGETISDDAARVLAEMLGAQLVQYMVDEMEEDLAIAYVANLTPESLAAYRAFLESPEGQEVAETMVVMTTEATKVGEEVGGRIAKPAVEKMIAQIQSGDMPAGTLKTTQRELMAVFSD